MKKLNYCLFDSDDLVQLCVDYLREYPLLFALMFGLPILLAAGTVKNRAFKNARILKQILLNPCVAFYFLMKSDSDERPKKKKKKNKDKSS